jgi:hypothetical protein
MNSSDPKDGLLISVCKGILCDVNNLWSFCHTLNRFGEEVDGLAVVLKDAGVLADDRIKQLKRTLTPRIDRLKNYVEFDLVRKVGSGKKC